MYIYIYIYIYICMYVCNANGDGRNGQTMQAGAAVAQAAQHALQFPPLCDFSSTGGPQPVDWILP